VANRKNIVLLHGWGADITKLEPLQKEMQGLGWDVLVPKLPGFQSPPPPTVWGVEDYAKHIKQVAQRQFKQERFVLFGHSFGGKIAISLASTGESSLAGLTLCGASGLSRPNIVKRTVFLVLAKVGRALLVIPPLAALFRKTLYKAAREHDYQKASGIMKEVFKKVIAHDSRPLVKKIKIPTLILWGQQDRVTPIKDARYLQSTLPNATLTVFENEGHRLPYNQPRELAQKIDQWFKNLN